MFKTSHLTARDTSVLLGEEGWPRIITYPVMFIIVFITIAITRVKCLLKR